MDINLYKNTSDKNYLNKNLSNMKVFNCNLKSDVNINTPDIIISGDMSLIAGYNYAYIPLFGRYYFVNSITILNNKTVSMSLKCDVLMSFKNEILQCEGIIERQEKLYNLYYNDSELNKVNYEQIQTLSFKNKLPVEPSFLMLTTGGASSV